MSISLKTKTLAIVNPISGGIDKEPIIQDLKGLFEDIHFFQTQKGNYKEELITEAKALQPKQIIIMGGDGTFKIAAEYLTDFDLAYLLLPLGSANGMCSELHLPSDSKAILEKLDSLELVKMDVLKINQEYCFHLADLGFNAKILKYFSDERGIWGYFKLYLKNLFNVDRYSFSIQINEKTITKKSVMIVVANGKFYGTGLSINPVGNMYDGKVDLIVIKPFSLWRLPKLLFNLVSGRLNQDAFVEHFQNDGFQVQNNDLAPFQIDGEPINDTKTIQIEMTKRKIKVFGLAKKDQFDLIG